MDFSFGLVDNAGDFEVQSVASTMVTDASDASTSVPSEAPMEVEASAEPVAEALTAAVDNTAGAWALLLSDAPEAGIGGTAEGFLDSVQYSSGTAASSGAGASAGAAAASLAPASTSAATSSALETAANDAITSLGENLTTAGKAIEQVVEEIQLSVGTKKDTAKMQAELNKLANRMVPYLQQHALNEAKLAAQQASHQFSQFLRDVLAKGGASQIGRDALEFIKALRETAGRNAKDAENEAKMYTFQAAVQAMFDYALAMAHEVFKNALNDTKDTVMDLIQEQFGNAISLTKEDGTRVEAKLDEKRLNDVKKAIGKYSPRTRAVLALTRSENLKDVNVDPKNNSLLRAVLTVVQSVVQADPTKLDALPEMRKLLRLFVPFLQKSYTYTWSAATRVVYPKAFTVALRSFDKITVKGDVQPFVDEVVFTRLLTSISQGTGLMAFGAKEADAAFKRRQEDARRMRELLFGSLSRAIEVAPEGVFSFYRRKPSQVSKDRLPIADTKGTMSSVGTEVAAGNFSPLFTALRIRTDRRSDTAEILNNFRRFSDFVRDFRPEDATTLAAAADAEFRLKEVNTTIDGLKKNLTDISRRIRSDMSTEDLRDTIRASAEHIGEHIEKDGVIPAYSRLDFSKIVSVHATLPVINDGDPAIMNFFLSIYALAMLEKQKAQAEGVLTTVKVMKEEHAATITQLAESSGSTDLAAKATRALNEEFDRLKERFNKLYEANRKLQETYAQVADKTNAVLNQALQQAKLNLENMKKQIDKNKAAAETKARKFADQVAERVLYAMTTVSTQLKAVAKELGGARGAFLEIMSLIYTGIAADGTKALSETTSFLDSVKKSYAKAKGKATVADVRRLMSLMAMINLAFQDKTDGIPPTLLRLTNNLTTPERVSELDGVQRMDEGEFEGVVRDILLQLLLAQSNLRPSDATGKVIKIDKDNNATLEDRRTGDSEDLVMDRDAVVGYVRSLYPTGMKRSELLREARSLEARPVYVTVHEAADDARAQRELERQARRAAQAKDSEKARKKLAEGHRKASAKKVADALVRRVSEHLTIATSSARALYAIAKKFSVESLLTMSVEAIDSLTGRAHRANTSFLASLRVVRKLFRDVSEGTKSEQSIRLIIEERLRESSDFIAKLLALVDAWPSITDEVDTDLGRVLRNRKTLTKSNVTLSSINDLFDDLDEKTSKAARELLTKLTSVPDRAAPSRASAADDEALRLYSAVVFDAEQAANLLSTA
jgi:hypothetical protein